MVLKVIKFRFTTPLHLSKARADYIDSYTHWHSDGWYAAIMQAWAVLGMHAPLKRLHEQDGVLDFTLSSLFPYATDTSDQTVFFLPRPMVNQEPLLAESLLDERDERRKALKKWTWVELERFGQCTQDSQQPWIHKWSELKGAYLTNRTLPPVLEDGALLHRVLAPKVTIDPTTGESTPYYLERLYFEKGCGWYGLFEGSEERWQEVQAAILLLGQEGIGTDRHTGNGKFEVCLATDEETGLFQRLFETKEPSSYYCNLSLYNPPNFEVLQDALAPPKEDAIGYQLIKRGGWITTPPYHALRRRPLYFFKEGSVLFFPDGQNPNRTGAICDVRPKVAEDTSYLQTNHPIWRVGKSFFVPFLIE